MWLTVFGLMLVAVLFLLLAVCIAVGRFLRRRICVDFEILIMYIFVFCRRRRGVLKVGLCIE
jgi:hypothetical protein